MIKKITQISFALFLVLMMVSCKNTKQKLQEFVPAYNAQAATFKADHVTLTTARGYINDNKVELRFETNLEQNKPNSLASGITFPKLLKDLIKKNEALKELLDEGVQIDAYFLANDNTVLNKEIINKERMAELLKL